MVLCRILGLMLAVWVAPAFGTQALRVGVLEEAPLAFMTENGRIKGLSVDILQQIARKLDWQLTYETGTESELLDRLAGNQIDLIANMPYSREYEGQYRFTQQYLFNNWAELATSQDSALESLSDLDGKRIGVVRASPHRSALQNLLREFGVEPELVEYPSFVAVAEALVNSEIDAGVLSRIFMLRRAPEYDIGRLPLTFAPLEIRYLAARSASDQVLAAIDQFLAQGKVSGTSAFYKIFDKWFPVDRSYKLPGHAIWLLFVVVALAAGVFLGRALQRKRTGGAGG